MGSGGTFARQPGVMKDSLHRVEVLLVMGVRCHERGYTRSKSEYDDFWVNL